MNNDSLQNYEEDNCNLHSGEIGPKTTGSGPIPPYAPLPSGLLQEPSKIVIGDQELIPVGVFSDFLH